MSRFGRGGPRSDWWLLGGCLLVLALAAFSIFQLRRHAGESIQAEARLAQLQIAINHLNALEWEAIAEGRPEAPNDVDARRRS